MIGPSQQVDFAVLVDVVGHRAVAQAQVEIANLDAGDATEAVLGDDHAFDQIFLDVSRWV
jgi:hypothetical protein